MSRKTARLLAAVFPAAVCATGAGGAEFPADRMFQTVPVGEGIYAFVSPETDGPIPSGNVTAVIGDDGVLVVDSGRFPTLTRRIIAEIGRKTEKPVHYLVHTHWHLDHIVGDAEFRRAFPGMAFVATDFTRRKMIEKQVGYLRDIEKNDGEYVGQIEAIVQRGTRRDGSAVPPEQLRYLKDEAADIRLEIAELKGVAVVEPDLTFDRELTIHLGKREVRVEFLGKGNTAGDAVVVVPDSGVVVTGDLLVAPVPYGYGCHPAAWLETLKALTAMRATAIVPGHGPVMHDWAYAKKVMALLEAIRTQVGAAVLAGATLEETRKRVSLVGYRRDFAGDDYGRGVAFDDFFVQSAVDRAYQEARGQMAAE